LCNTLVKNLAQFCIIKLTYEKNYSSFKHHRSTLLMQAK
jgi:hypothetical protein